MAGRATRSTVLVIDDSPTIAKVVQLVLTKAGFVVQTAADGEAGLAAVRAERPDLILLDFVMPRMNGYQFCRELNADPKLRDIPVVLMSAKGDQVGDKFVKVMGIVDSITKPFSPEAITAVVQHTLATRRPAAEDATPPVAAEATAADEDADRARARSTALAELRAATTRGSRAGSTVASDAAGPAAETGPTAQAAEPAVDTPALDTARPTAAASTIVAADERPLIERAIDNVDIVFLRDEDSIARMGRDRLTPDELAVLDLVNGTHTVQDIIRMSRMQSFEVSKILYRLLSIKLIRRRALPITV